MTNFIELHVKTLFGNIRRVSIPIGKIYKVLEEKNGASILYARRDAWGDLFSVHCLESYDEVMALLDIR